MAMDIHGRRKFYQVNLATAFLRRSLQLPIQNRTVYARRPSWFEDLGQLIDEVIMRRLETALTVSSRGCLPDRFETPHSVSVLLQLLDRHCELLREGYLVSQTRIILLLSTTKRVHLLQVVSRVFQLIEDCVQFTATLAKLTPDRHLTF